MLFFDKGYNGHLTTKSNLKESSWSTALKRVEKNPRTATAGQALCRRLWPLPPQSDPAEWCATPRRTHTSDSRRIMPQLLVNFMGFHNLN